MLILTMYVKCFRAALEVFSDNSSPFCSSRVVFCISFIKYLVDIFLLLAVIWRSKIYW